MRRVPFFYRESHGIRIRVRPVFARDRSAPAHSRYVFIYFVRIENVGAQPARLLRRQWLIHDSAGEDTEVEGDGVVGEQPRIAPGEVFEYESFCVLRSPSGWMTGKYLFVGEDGSAFAADIPRFTLEASASAGPLS